MYIYLSYLVDWQFLAVRFFDLKINIALIIMERWGNTGGPNLKAFPANTKHLYSICTTSAQRLRR